MIETFATIPKTVSKVFQGFSSFRVNASPTKIRFRIKTLSNSKLFTEYKNLT